MPYTLKYRLETSNRRLLDSPQFSNYRFDIAQLDYSGGFTTLQCGSNPITHKWSLDEPKAPIKGSSVQIRYINFGNQPLRIFYSESDIEFQGTLTNLTTGEVLFKGFLSLEDSSEPLTDGAHECVLTFNDGLGLLKEVDLETAFNNLGYNIFQKCTLLDILFACLSATSTELPTRIFSEVYELTVPQTNSTFGQTRIDPSAFVTDEDTFDNCYNVLEKILKPLRVTCMQAVGYWYFVRFDDAKYSGNAMLGYQWDVNRTPLGEINFTQQYIFGSDKPTKPIFSVQEKAFRAYQFVRSTFNYKNPVELIKNKNLKRLGALVSSTTIGTVKYDKYQFAPSSQWQHFNGDTSLLVIETDIPTGKEIQRYIEQPFIEGGSTPPRTCWQFNDIEVNANDRIKMSMQFRANADLTTDRFGVIINLIKKPNGAVIGPSPDFKWATLTDGTTGGVFWRWNKNNVDYNTSAVPGNFIQYDNVQNADQWHSFDLSTYMQTKYGEDIPVPVIPADGILKIYVVGWNEQGNQPKTGYIKDIQFSLDFLINESASVIGQVHNQINPVTVKNNLQEEIFTDDSPRFSIAGTLFNMDTSGILPKRTVQWTSSYIAASQTLGHINAFDELFQRRKARVQLEGGFAGLVQPNATTLSLASIMKIDELAGYNFVAGMMELNYRDDSVNLTMYEMYQDGEVPTDLVDLYSFTYLYKND